ncbi:MAG: TIGR03790 family protein [Paucibacter sp.]|nr:TIGR03790 family protein [Roseateles sp.]
MPKLQGRITAQNLGLVINLDDPYSVAVGKYYQLRRHISDAHVLRLHVPVKPRLSQGEFAELETRIRKQMPEAVQGLALAWRQPYAVECNGITSALAHGYQPKICEQTCAASEPSSYASYLGNQPFADKGVRPAMLIAARSEDSARQLIDRGVAADASLPSAFLAVNAWFLSTSDAARNARSVWFPPAGTLRPWMVDVKRVEADQLPAMQRALIVQTGLARVEGLDRIQWLPGALADHLTSFGGLLDAAPGEGQMSAIDWIESGATASYGTVSEPCNHWQKFPHPQLLMLSYIQGVTALEAYWHSVVWPAQGVFIGEPLAAPFAPTF